MEKRNVVNMIDLTQFMLMESSGDSEAKSDLGTASSFPRPGRRFVADFDSYFGNHNDDDNNDDDAESCSYGCSSHGGNYADDGFCHDDYRDKGNVHHDDGMSYDDDDDNHDEDDEMEEDDDAIDSKMVEEEVSKKCGGAFVMGDCSNSTKFMKSEKENDKNFWETCLAS